MQPRIAEPASMLVFEPLRFLRHIAALMSEMGASFLLVCCTLEVVPLRHDGAGLNWSSLPRSQEKV